VAATQAGKSQLRIGRLTKAHGLKGGIKVEMFTDDPDGRFTPGAVFTLQVPDSSAWHNKTIELSELKWYNSHAVAFFKDVPDRSVAETLIKAILWIDHDLSEIPEEEDAWFDHQLLGLEVLRDGVKVGTVTAIDHFPAQDLLTVKTENGDVLVPFVKAIVASVDVKAGTMTVTPPVGLFEELPDDEQPGAEKLVEYIEPDAAGEPGADDSQESTPAAPSES
jgi:16S rRNA processing protein RimM